MASRYWVGGTATWDGTAGTKWATTSGGAGGAAVPTAADDVFLDASSGANIVTLSSSSVCRSLDCNGFTGTLSHPASTTLTIGDGTAGAGNRALRLSSGMTYVAGGAQTFSFVSTSPTAQTLTAAGKTINAHFTFNGAGGSWQLADAFTSAGGNNIWTLTAGTLDTNSQTLSAGSFTSVNSNTRTLKPGSSSITLSGAGQSWSTSTSTNMTITANTATLTQSGGTTTIHTGAFSSMNGMSLVLSGSGIATVTSSAAWQNVTRIGTAAKTDMLQIAAVLTANSTLTIQSNSDVNRILVFGFNYVARTITAASVVITNTVDFMDIAAAGAATWTVAGTGATALGDALGNSGITFTTPATQTHTASAGGNWSDVTKWTSRVPLPQDNVIIDGNTTGTLTADMPRLGKDVDCTGFGGTLSLTSTANSIFGSLTLASALTLASSQSFVFSGRGNHTVTSTGKSFGGSVIFQAVGGTYSLQDAFAGSGSSSTLSINDGTFATNNFDVTYAIFAAASGRATTLSLGSSTISLTSTAPITIWNTNTSTTTVNGSSSTIVITNASTSTRSFTGGISGTKSFGTLTYTVANSPGQLSLSSPSNFTNFNVASGRILSLISAFTTTVGNSFNVNGINNGYLYLPGVTGNYISTPDSAALSITGDIDVRARVKMIDWTPAGTAPILAKNTNTGNNRSYHLRVDAAGTLSLVMSPDGITQTTSTSSVPTGFVDGTTHWIRATWRQSDGRLQYFTADGSLTSPSTSDWIQLGIDRANIIASIFDSTAPVEIGSTGNGSAESYLLSAMEVYRAQIRSNILDNGTGIVFDANFTAKPVGANSFTESSTNAATVTINGALAQVGDGRVSLVSSTPGTQATLSKATGVVSCNYLSIQDSNATGGAAWYAGANSIDVSNNTGWIFASATGTPSTSNFFEVFE